jgi:hypothetical protein
MTTPLPRITKTIIYLDQFVLSNMLSGTESRWEAVFQRMRLLNWLQAICCPFSKIHREESLLADQSRDAHKELYRELSGGVEFLAPIEIEQSQLLDAVRRYLQGSPQPLQWQKPKPWQEFCKDDPHRWTLDMAVYADFPHDPSRVQRLQADKDDLHADLSSVADLWRTEKNSFKDDVERESLAYGRSLLEAYRHLAGGRKRIEAAVPPEMLEAFQVAFGLETFDPNTPPGVQPGVMLVHWLAVEVHRLRPNEPDPVAVVEQFFQSKHAMEVPFQYIASRLWAAIAQMVRNPKGPRASKPSDGYDVTAISHYAPYCDAMIVDNEFYAMASQKNIDVPGKFGVRLFCSKTLDAFLRYLDDLATNLQNDHREALRQVYPQFSELPWLKASYDG